MSKERRKDERIEELQRWLVEQTKLNAIYKEQIEDLRQMVRDYRKKFGEAQEELGKQSEGQWITKGDELKNTTCSVCGYWVETPYGKTPYCPNCGAKMKGGE